MPFVTHVNNTQDILREENNKILDFLRTCQTFIQKFEFWKSYLQPNRSDLWFSVSVIVQVFPALFVIKSYMLFVGNVSVLLAGMGTPARSSPTS
jgi:hypothetical protein